MISSTANKQIKTVNSLKNRARERRKEGLFVVEGPRMCREIPKERIVSVYLSETFAAKPEAEDFLRDKNAELVSDDVFRSMADTQNPQGILAIVRQKEYTLDDVFPGDGKAALILLLEQVQDPGNLGTMVRSAEGAGVSGIVMDDKTADIYSPKVIRSTMGSIFRVPFVRTDDLAGDIKTLSSQGVKIFAADLTGKEAYDKADLRGPCAFCIGNEAAGLSGKILALADERLLIPMRGEVESLNAAVASAVLIFEAARQRRGRS